MQSTRLYDTTLRDAPGAAAQIRVLIESSDGEHSWSTVGSWTCIISASWTALADSLEHWSTSETSRLLLEVAPAS